MVRRPVLLLLPLAAVACVQQEPFFASVLLPQDTTDQVGPYRIQAYVVAPAGVKRLVVRFFSEPYDPSNPETRDSGELRFAPLDPEEEEGPWLVELDGRPAGTQLWYQLVLVEATTGALARDPIDAPETEHSFRVLSGD